jgi:hypothetical protein
MDPQSEGKTDIDYQTELLCMNSPRDKEWLFLKSIVLLDNTEKSSNTAQTTAFGDANENNNTLLEGILFFSYNQI